MASLRYVAPRETKSQIIPVLKEMTVCGERNLNLIKQENEVA